jgi:hypothetical protein
MVITSGSVAYSWLSGYCRFLFIVVMWPQLEMEVGFVTADVVAVAMWWFPRMYHYSLGWGGNSVRCMHGISGNRNAPIADCLAIINS